MTTALINGPDFLLGRIDSVEQAFQASFPLESYHCSSSPPHLSYSLHFGRAGKERQFYLHAALQSLHERILHLVAHEKLGLHDLVCAYTAKYACMCVDGCRRAHATALSEAKPTTANNAHSTVFEDIREHNRSLQTPSYGSMPPNTGQTQSL